MHFSGWAQELIMLLSSVCALEIKAKQNNIIWTVLLAVSWYTLRTRIHYILKLSKTFSFWMFPGPAQRKQIDKIGQIFSGFLSTCFLGRNPSNIWMFEKWKQHCWQVYLRAFFWWDLRKTNQNSCIMSPNFPWPALQKKLYIYILYIYTIYIYTIYIYIYIYYIYILYIL